MDLGAEQKAQTKEEIILPDLKPVTPNRKFRLKKAV